MLVLGHSLKDGGANAKLVALVTLENLSQQTVEELKVCAPDPIFSKLIHISDGIR